MARCDTISGPCACGAWHAPVTPLSLARDRERAWREHYGILCDLFPPEEEDDTPYVKCLTCGFKVIFEHHMTNVSMFCLGGVHRISVGNERFVYGKNRWD